MGEEREKRERASSSGPLSVYWSFQTADETAKNTPSRQLTRDHRPNRTPPSTKTRNLWREKIKGGKKIANFFSYSPKIPKFLLFFRKIRSDFSEKKIVYLIYFRVTFSKVFMLNFFRDFI